MKRIVLVGNSEKPCQVLLECLQYLFPECEISVVMPKEDAPVASERESEVMERLQQALYTR